MVVGDARTDRRHHSHEQREFDPPRRTILESVACSSEFLRVGDPLSEQCVECGDQPKQLADLLHVLLAIPLIPLVGEPLHMAAEPSVRPLGQAAVTRSILTVHPVPLRAMQPVRLVSKPASKPGSQQPVAERGDFVRSVVVGVVTEHGIDASHIVFSGESGGGNLQLALAMRLQRQGEISLVRGIFAMCPYIAGRWPDERFPSSVDNNGIVMDLHSNFARLTYGVEEYEAKTRQARRDGCA